MNRQEHIVIISAGEGCGTAFAVAVREVKTISRVFVFADSALYTNSARDNEQRKVHKAAVRKAVDRVKALAGSLKIPAALIYIDPPAQASVVKALDAIRTAHPGTRYSFDISGGSKDLSLALFLASLWFGGDAYYAFERRKETFVPAEKLAIPRIPLKGIATNQNYLRILAVLAGKPGKNDTLPRILPRSYLFTQLEPFYVPVKKSGVRMNLSKTKTDAVTGKRAMIPVLSQGTFSSLLNTLECADLVQEVPGPAGNRKEKY